VNHPTDCMYVKRICVCICEGWA